MQLDPEIFNPTTRPDRAELNILKIKYPHSFQTSLIIAYKFHRTKHLKRIQLQTVTKSRSLVVGRHNSCYSLQTVVSTKPRDWLGRTSPKCPILCRIGLKTNSINHCSL